MHSSLQINRISFPEKFALINEHWRPKVVAELNGQVRLVKFQGVFPSHYHQVQEEDVFRMGPSDDVEFRDRTRRHSSSTL